MKRHDSIIKLLASFHPDDILLITNACDYDHIGVKKLGIYPFLTKEAGLGALMGKLGNHDKSVPVIILNGKENTDEHTDASICWLRSHTNWSNRLLSPSSWPFDPNDTKTVSKYNAKIKHRKENWKAVAKLEYIDKINQNYLFELFPSLKSNPGKPGGRVYQGGCSTVSLAKRAARRK